MQVCVRDRSEKPTVELAQRGLATDSPTALERAEVVARPKNYFTFISLEYQQQFPTSR